MKQRADRKKSLDTDQLEMKSRSSINAVLISDSFTSEFGPLTDRAPRLLLPVANRPTIDYILESLLLNGVNKLYIFAFSFFMEISQHLNSIAACASRPVSCTSGSAIASYGDLLFAYRELEVHLLPCDHTSIGRSNIAYHVFTAITRRNVVDGNFFYIPCDSIFHIEHMKAAWRNHFERHLKNPKCILTSIAIEDEVSLRRAHDRVASSCFRDQMAGRSFYSTLDDCADATPVEVPQAAECSQRFAVSMTDPASGVVIGYHRFDDRANTFAEAVLSLDKNTLEKPEVYIRADLLHTGIYIVHTDLLSVLGSTSMERNMAEVFHHIVHQYEVEQNRCAIEVASRNSFTFIADTVSSYLRVNIAVAERLLFPMTREAVFADVRSSYVVTRQSPSVYVSERKTVERVNEPGKIQIQSNSVGPNVIVGQSTAIPEGAVVSCSVLGRNVRIGKCAKIFNSVVFDDVCIGNSVEVNRSVIASDVHLADNTVVRAHCVIGNGVQISSTEKVDIPAGTRLEFNPKTPSDAKAVGTHGRGDVWTRPESERESQAFALEALFVHDELDDSRAPSYEESVDNLPNVVDDETFIGYVQEVVEKYIGERGKDFEAILQHELKMLMMHWCRTLADVSAAVLASLMHHVAVRPDVKASSAGKAVNELITDFKSILLEGMKIGDHETLLRSFAMTLSQHAVLQQKADHILAHMYWQLDPALFKSRGYCLISPKSIVDFDEELHRFESDSLSPSDERLIDGWKSVKKFAENLRRVA